MALVAVGRVTTWRSSVCVCVFVCIHIYLYASMHSRFAFVKMDRAKEDEQCVSWFPFLLPPPSLSL